MKRITSWLTTGLVVLVTIAATRTSDAELVIELDKVGIKPSPIAIVPFGNESGTALPVDVASVIANDLARSGRFAPLDADKMLSRPTRGIDVNFSDWRRVGVDSVLVGRVEKTTDGFLLQFQLFDVFGARQILGYRLPASERGLRLAAHRAADMVYEQLTGIAGVFSTRIAYITVTGPVDKRRYSMVVADADGENQYVIAQSTEYPLMSPAWSPDGRELAYVSFQGGQSSIVVQSLRTGTVRTVSRRNGINGAPAWSPDGRTLAVTLSGDNGNPDIWLLRVTDGQARRLTSNRAIDTEASFSPDGRYVYFTSDRAGAPQVYRIGVDGGDIERVTFEGSYNARPRLSPNGDKLAVVHQVKNQFRIAAHDVERRDVLVLTEGSQDESPAFAPNGETIIYATRRNGKGVLQTVSIDGAVSQRLAASEGDVREPVWSPFRRQ
ncbi:MAG: Tol-Pal system beta propeller repeat protein TolB [Pseudomonadota bacterium]